MDQKTLVVLQKTHSPFRQVVHETLLRKNCVRIFRRQGLPLPDAAFKSEAIVLWDISGFGQDEVGQTAAELWAKEAGPVVLCKVWDESCRQILHQVKVLEFVADPACVAHLSQALDSAWLLRERLWRLKDECLELARRLSDRQIIDQAKWLLVRCKDFSEAEALRRMQRYSRKTNQKLVQVAKNLLTGYEVLADQMNYLSGC